MTRMRTSAHLLFLLLPFVSIAFLTVATPLRAAPPAQTQATLDPEALAKSATIYRDVFGVPHIDGPTDQSVTFAFAYAQAEDFFWQVEDSCILGLGRYAEINGQRGLKHDLLNRAFQIAARSKADYPNLDPQTRSIIEAFTAGLNYYLACNPQTKPRLLTRFEPWYLQASSRHILLEMCYRMTGITDSYIPGAYPDLWTNAGSNAWAIGPSRTKSKNAILFVNPHQPWFGFGQFYEAHIRSGQGWNFSGATFFGMPFLSIGHNEHLGWTFTFNEPDVADLWRLTFNDPDNPLRYRYGDGYKTAVERKETIKIKTSDGLVERQYTFRDTHYGPIVAKVKNTENQFLAARIAKLYDAMFLRQLIKLVRTKTLDEFKAAMAGLELQIMNAIYADRQGNIYYLYNGTVPRRNPRFDWTKPVDGSDPATEWKGLHRFDELPQVQNPPTGYVQNCNSTPFATTDDGNPFAGDFPPYMCRDKHDDKRRAKISRRILRTMQNVTFDDVQEAAFDTTLYWPLNELPKFAREFEQLTTADPKLAADVAPYFNHLLDWDCICTADSTQATLCVEWYAELYGSGYPAETLKSIYRQNPLRKYKALIKAAKKLEGWYGNWKVPWGEVHRIQRHPNVADFYKIPFSDELPSLPSLAVPGPLGVVFTGYYTPPIHIPLLKTVKKRYGVVGATYMAVIEFGEKIRAATLLQFGQSANPDSPNYFDQARLLSQQKLKPQLFYWDDVLANAKTVYRPGEKPRHR